MWGQFFEGGISLHGISVKLRRCCVRAGLECSRACGQEIRRLRKRTSLNNAVQQASSGDTITFTGVCKESVTVATSGITLTGDGNAVIQSPSPSQDALIVDGAQRDFDALHRSKTAPMEFMPKASPGLSSKTSPLKTTPSPAFSRGRFVGLHLEFGAQ